MKNYRKAFAAAVAFNVLLIAGILFLWFGRRPQNGNTVSTAHSAPASVKMQSTEKTTGGRSNGMMQRSDETSAAPQELPLAAVQMTPQRMQSIGVETSTVQYKAISDPIRANGNVDIDETSLSYVQLRFPGWVRKVFVNSTYQRVRKGDPLFTVYSPDLVTTENEYLLARRYRQLLAGSSLAQVVSGSESLLSAAKARLEQWEVPAREIAQLEETGKARDYLEIDSPVSGYVIERNALPNLYAEPSTKLYTIADLSTVWIYAQIFQTDIGKLRVGFPARVTVDSYPGQTFRGQVDYILPQVDTATRTVKVRLVFRNPGLKLKPGMFVNVDLDVPLGRQLAIPSSGVFHSGTRTVAFVDRGNGYLEPREVELGATAGDSSVVLRGLKAGERIVTSANFLIDSESQMQAAMGAFAPPPPVSGRAATKPPNAKLDFTTDPATPHKGSNILRVKLSNAGGQPIVGAKVTVNFYMAAMPAMGMAAMRSTATLQDRGAGIYQGTTSLGSGGTWQVTIIAEQNGQTIATQQISVNAEGGM
jgi:RND family efflux transporter MFP subunit